ncbi:glycosyltransferase [Empedobacter falsenii]|uniref:glycosyltransferase n=1 Tax=Empedobacter falsenii TaxID=343874 RepID=UPI003A7FDACC
MFSVLSSVYAKENPDNLNLALESLFKQTVCANEIVIVKDGPLTDELEEVISEFKNKYPNILKIIPLKENVGLGNALNEGLKHITNNIVARMDTDDICYVNRFEKQLQFLKDNPEISVVGGIVQEFNQNPGDLKQFRKLPLLSDDLYKFAKYRNPLSHPSVMFKKDDVLNAGSYQDMPFFEDYYLWIRMLLKEYKIANINDTILHFRIGNDMIGRRSGFSYAKKEIRFIRASKNLGFLSQKDFINSLLIKVPLRVLPKSFLTFLYKKLLR